MNQLDDIKPLPADYLSGLSDITVQNLADGKFQIIHRHIRELGPHQYVWYEINTENRPMLLRGIFWFTNDAHTSIINEAKYVMALRNSLRKRYGL